MAATVSKLLDHLKSVTPKEELIGLDEMATDPEKRSQQLECKANDDIEGFCKILGTCLPTEADEVYKNIFLGGKKHVTDLDYVKKIGITDIINVAHSKQSDGGYTIDEAYYKENGIDYYGFVLSDSISSEYSKEYEEQLKEVWLKVVELSNMENKRIMVACHAGMSRSATAVLCYLIQKEKMTAFEAITQVREIRNILPSGQQLIYVARLHNEIFGHADVEVIDGEIPLTYLRQMYLALKNRK